MQQQIKNIKYAYLFIFNSPSIEMRRFFFCPTPFFFYLDGFLELDGQTAQLLFLVLHSSQGLSCTIQVSDATKNKSQLNIV